MQKRYPDSGVMWSAVEAARADGTLRRFRVKYQPAMCSCCGKSLRTGQPVVSAERGMLVGRCCWWDEGRDELLTAIWGEGAA